MPSPGDKVKISTADEVIEGILMPSLDANIISIKLDSGYNIGVNKGKIRKIEVVQEHMAIPKESLKTSLRKELPIISILHTGGTIASKIDYNTGGTIAQFSPEELLVMFPELADIANIRSKLVRNMQSEFMRFAHYNLLAKEIEKEVKEGVDGIIITHGTDTMHYSSAALAFILNDLPVPVILVGAQRSSDRGSSDAFQNLISAAYFIAHSDFGEVAICMHHSMSDKHCVILPATKTRKMHTSRRDAFRPINIKEFARVNFEDKKIHFENSDYARKDKKRKLNLMLINEKLKIGLLKQHPNMTAEEYLSYKDFDGLVIELFGLGHAPTYEIDEFTKEHPKIKEAITLLCKKMPVIGAPQTIYGRIQMNVYSPGRELIEIGVLGNNADMTPETAFIKLAWLLSNFKKEEIKELIAKNFRGEISERTEPEEIFLI